MSVDASRARAHAADIACRKDPLTIADRHYKLAKRLSGERKSAKATDANQRTSSRSRDAMMEEHVLRSLQGRILGNSKAKLASKFQCVAAWLRHGLCLPIAALLSLAHLTARGIEGILQAKESMRPCSALHDFKCHDGQQGGAVPAAKTSKPRSHRVGICHSNRTCSCKRVKG